MGKSIALTLYPYLYENFPLGNLDLALAQHRLSQPSVGTNPLPLPMTIDVVIDQVNSLLLKDCYEYPPWSTSATSYPMMPLISLSSLSCAYRLETLGTSVETRTAQTAQPAQPRPCTSLDVSHLGFC